MIEWIDVNDRLPVPDEANTSPSIKVLVWAAGAASTFHTAHYSYVIRDWMVHTDYFSTGHRYSITHWAHIPGPPKVGARATGDIQSMSAWRDDEEK